jgi:hypothetical protein
MNSNPYRIVRTGRRRLGLSQPSGLVVLVLGMIGGLAAASPETSAPVHQNFDVYSAISDRNIFNTTRSHRTSQGGDTQPAPRIDTLTLYGTFIYDKGPFAFFTGSGSEYQQVLGAGKSVAGFTIVEITGTGVKLSGGTNRFELRVGMELRREEGGEWQMAGDRGEPSNLGSRSGRAADDSASSEETDMVKRMMKQRELELQ